VEKPAHRSEVAVGRTAYPYEVDDAGALTVWGPGVSGDRIVGRGRVVRDGSRHQIKDASAGLTEPLMHAIEEQLNGVK
jgi:hypothetical protein